jgi:hypothetical protein
MTNSQLSGDDGVSVSAAKYLSIIVPEHLAMGKNSSLKSPRESASGGVTKKSENDGERE